MHKFPACLNPLFLFSSFWESCYCPRTVLSPQGHSATLSCGSPGVFLMTSSYQWLSMGVLTLCPWSKGKVISTAAENAPQAEMQMGLH